MPQKGIHILLADDSRENRLLIQVMLQDTPYTLHLAVNGQEAANQFASTPFDLVIMDVSMPVMDGYEATRKMRRIEKHAGHSHTPIIALTSFDVRENQGKIQAAGYDLRITKPIQKKQLLELIDHYCKHARNPELFPQSPDPATRSTATSSKQAHISTNEDYIPFLENDSENALNQQVIATLKHNLREHIRPLLLEYVTSLPQRLQTLGQSLHHQDERTLQVTAHNLKGAAAIIGAHRLQHLAESLEKAFQQGVKNPSIREILAAMHNEMERVLSEIRELLMADPP
ncbi:MAG: response regulator [Magnetococcus sp. DMHC-1]|nr:response regulator [Magnetococcales bacterium]